MPMAKAQPTSANNGELIPPIVHADSQAAMKATELIGIRPTTRAELSENVIVALIGNGV